MWKAFLESLASISRRTKGISLYWIILWMKHQRVLKLLNCLQVVVMTIFLWSISHKIYSIKINALLTYIPITWWISRTPETIHNLLLSQDKYAWIRWSSLCRLTKAQHHLRIPTWCLIWNHTLREVSNFRVRSNILEDPQHVYITHWKRKIIICEVTVVRVWCRGLPPLPMRHLEMAHINFHGWVFVSKNVVNKILKLYRK